MVHCKPRKHGRGWIRFDENEKIPLIKHLLQLWKKKINFLSFFPDFISIFHTFSRSGKWLDKFQDFFKYSRLCTNPVRYKKRQGLGNKGSYIFGRTALEARRGVTSHYIKKLLLWDNAERWLLGDELLNEATLRIFIRTTWNIKLTEFFLRTGRNHFTVDNIQEYLC